MIALLKIPQTHCINAKLSKKISKIPYYHNLCYTPSKPDNGSAGQCQDLLLALLVARPLRLIDDSGGNSEEQNFAGRWTLKTTLRRLLTGTRILGNWTRAIYCVPQAFDTLPR